MVVLKRLTEAGYEAVLVGGCVRDLYLGQHPKDYDVATAATPPQVDELFDRVVDVGVSFGVLRILIAEANGPEEVEVATFRQDGPYQDGRHPTTVDFTNLVEDVKRRDFSLNGLAMRPTAEGGAVIDHVGGLQDLADKILRAIGDPMERFEEDALRLLRGVRFAARFGLQIEPATSAAMRACRDKLVAVSFERVQSELLSMLRGPDGHRAALLMAEHGLHAPIWPELERADPALGRTSERIRLLREQLAEGPAQLGEYVVCEELEPALATAAFFAATRGEDGRLPVVIRETLRLSNVQLRGLTEIYSVRDQILALATAAPSLEPVAPEVIRCLRSEQGDAGLCLAMCDATEAQRDWLRRARQARAKASAARWAPTKWVTGARLREMGYAPGPSFRAALWAAEAKQLSGGDEATCLQEAVSVLGRVD